jgi:hypothetical protein
MDVPAGEDRPEDGTFEDPLEEEESQGRRKVSRQVKYPSVSKEHWREVDADLNFSDLEWDLQATQGQARPFSTDILESRLKDFRECLPSGRIKVVVWPQDAFGMPWFKDARLPIVCIISSDNKFVVLGGQHSSKALSILREEFLGKQGERGVPVPLTGVKADILHHEATLAVRKLVAGEAQFAQEGVSSIPLSCFAARLLEFKPEKLNLADRQLIESIISKAIACCGYRRPSDPVRYQFQRRASSNSSLLFPRAPFTDNTVVSVDSSGPWVRQQSQP